ncbi:hyaluronan and proteoglycan link protein 3 [Centrocercus urophasianus]|uniref:hyaluronan and proteoglycan link protein 3 n=1 Tax=Centrocercus urophasianus TaxID=9002 RepID=UPI001C64D3DE|nr:hyaluronan and proteoglycan link protein 3 [Centrocercus urophasianus]XP_042680421.1 hyaluronan and proteoglycan link protein 3 [Centrocercus urophasianus]
MLLLSLLLKAALLRLINSYHPFYNGFYYNHVMNDDDNGHEKVIDFNGVRLVVETSKDPIYSFSGANVTLPCHYHHEPESEAKHKIRIKWSKLRDDYTKEQDVLVAIGKTYMAFGDFRGRAHLHRTGQREASLLISDVRLQDDGKYRCEVIEGLEDASDVVELRLRGIVFPYQPPRGQYSLNFHEAERVCQEQGALIATFHQLFQAWSEGLDWCNAGWLADGTVHYPIRLPRKPCGGVNLAPGIRSYGPRHRHLHRFDVFCFSSTLRGEVFYLEHPTRMTLEEAKQACLDAGAEIAKVGHLYSAWKFHGLDRCDAGWLADGSVRYPIAKPRANCGPAEPGVRSFGFPSKGRFGVFCYKER